MIVYVAKPTGEIRTAQQLRDVLARPPGADLVRGVLEWKGHVTADYFDLYGLMDTEDARLELEALVEKGFCRAVEVENPETVSPKQLQG